MQEIKAQDHKTDLKDVIANFSFVTVKMKMKLQLMKTL
jgi:hypothetical protein